MSTFSATGKRMIKCSTVLSNVDHAKITQWLPLTDRLTYRSLPVMEKQQCQVGICLVEKVFYKGIG